MWLTPGGLPKKAYGWEDTFQAANARVAAAWVRAGGEAGECPLWARPHMARHSFALKWFSVWSVAWEQRIAGFSSEEMKEMKDLRDQFGDIWYQLATLLGHRDPMTTRNVYLEPFTALDVDYLMSLLDGEEKDAVDMLVAAVGAITALDADGLPSSGGENEGCSGSLRAWPTAFPSTCVTRSPGWTRPTSTEPSKRYCTLRVAGPQRRERRLQHPPRRQPPGWDRYCLRVWVSQQRRCVRI